MISMILLFMSLAHATENCNYLDNPKVIKSTYSDICYAEIKCELHNIPVYNTAACKSLPNGKCPNVTECIGDKSIHFFTSKIEVFEKTQSNEGIVK